MEYNYQYIKNLIAHKEEESLKLEFKNTEALKNKKEMAKDVSAMANSAGGIIVYGINEVDHKADNLSTIDGNKYNKEWFENVLVSNIHRPIKDLKIHPIRLEGKISKSIYVIEIPESEDTPHMASNNRYYRRHNFQCIPMDEYEVRALYFKNKTPDLYISSMTNKTSVEIEEHHGRKIAFSKPSFQIYNEGNGISLNHKIVIEMNELDKYTISVDALRSKTSLSQSLNEDKSRIISIYDKTPIFPEELTSIGDFKFGYLFDEISKEKETDEKKIKVKILHETGVDSMNLSLYDFYRNTDIEKYI
ncbi:ATP-binding protein [Fodinibius sp.]|uniref:AlbA family DNA-binding domain-containing protein n=1 Tax=Fodinibius sp. TaxID=1872440 RepID=UPI002ACEAB87|nr:ATP-binding protein [Fodinibius sp.]MDZ7657782.1 ATP-binding protein [Fodinibius sp.]